MKYSNLSELEAQCLFNNACDYYRSNVTTTEQRKALARAGLHISLKVWVNEKGRQVEYSVMRKRECLKRTKVPKRLSEFVDMITALEA